MESAQSYYLYKLQNDSTYVKQRKQQMLQALVEKKRERQKQIMRDAILWSKESICTIMSYPDVQMNLLKFYFPLLNQENIKTFEWYSSMQRVFDYCEQVVTDCASVSTGASTGAIHVITITKRQIILIEKTFQEVYILDPTGMLSTKSIHDIRFLEEKLIPMFVNHGYSCEFVKLTYPAITQHHDPYTETWFMILLMDCLQQLYMIHSIDILVIPDKLHEKYNMIVEFHREILQYKYIQNEVMSNYLDHINNNKYSIQTFDDLDFVLDINPTELILQFKL
jgi:hypothetical protein